MDQEIMVDILRDYFRLEPPYILNEFYKTLCPTLVANQVAPFPCRCSLRCLDCENWKKKHLENIVTYIVYNRTKEDIENYWQEEEEDEITAGSWIGTEDEETTLSNMMDVMDL